MLNRFGYTTIEQELAGANIHRLENVLTLAHPLHTAFDHLYLWFDAVPNEVWVPASSMPMFSY